MHNGCLVKARVTIISTTSLQAPVVVRTLVNELDDVRGDLGRDDDLGERSLSSYVQERMDRVVDVSDDDEEDTFILPFSLERDQVIPPRVVIDLSASPAPISAAVTSPVRLLADLDLDPSPPSPQLEALPSPLSPISPASVRSEASTRISSPISPRFLVNAGYTPPAALKYSNNFVSIIKEAIDAYVSEGPGNPVMFLCSHWNAREQWLSESIIADHHKQKYFLKNNLTRKQMYRDAHIEYRGVLPHCTHCYEVFDTEIEGHFEQRFCPCIDYHKICSGCVADEVHDPIYCDDCGTYATKKRSRSHEFFEFCAAGKKQRIH